MHYVTWCSVTWWHWKRVAGCRSSLLKTDLKWTREKNSITVSKAGDLAEFALLSMKSCQLGLLCSQKCILSKTTNYFASVASNLYEAMSWTLLSKGKAKQSIRTNPLLIQKICHIWGFQLQIVHLAASYKCMCINACFCRGSYSFILHFCYNNVKLIPSNNTVLKC